jgi:hypothetical protein
MALNKKDRTAQCWGLAYSGGNCRGMSFTDATAYAFMAAMCSTTSTTIMPPSPGVADVASRFSPTLLSAALVSLAVANAHRSMF